LKEAKLKEKVGTAIDVGLEKVIALRPDIVFATSLFMELARLIGEEEKAIKVVRRVEAQVMRIMEKVEGLRKPRVFVEIGARPLFTVTGDSFINDLVTLAGVNIAQGAGFLVLCDTFLRMCVLRWARESSWG